MKSVEKILSLAGQDLPRLLGDELLSLAVYGSAATSDFHPQVSDINLLLVVKNPSLALLDQVRQYTRRMQKHGMAAPLVLTPATIQSSTDIFPIEFLEIKERHRVLFGEDMFSRLEIDTRNLRHECEHELKGRLLRMRQTFLESGHKPRAVKNLLLSAHNTNFPAFRSVLRLKQLPVPLLKEDVAEALVRHFGLDQELFLRMKLLRRGELTPRPEVLRNLLEQYLTEVRKLAAVVDAL